MAWWKRDRVTDRPTEEETLAKVSEKAHKFDQQRQLALSSEGVTDVGAVFTGRTVQTRDPLVENVEREDMFEKTGGWNWKTDQYGRPLEMEVSEYDDLADVPEHELQEIMRIMHRFRK